MTTTRSQSKPRSEPVSRHGIATTTLCLIAATLLTITAVTQQSSAHTIYCSDSINTNELETLSPLEEQTSEWTFADDSLHCYPATSFCYGRICLYSNLTDCSVEGVISFGPGGYGGGVGGRLNPQTGAHYAVWVYPQYTSGAGNLLRIVKFSNWTSWTLLTETSVNLASSNRHALKVTFHGNDIIASFDGAEVARATDTAYTQGGVTAEMWSNWNPYEFSVEHFTVSTPILPPSETPTPVLITDLTPQAGGTMQITASGDLGVTYVLQASRSCRSDDWTSIATNTANTAGLVQFSDTAAPNHPSRFYRILTP